ncbi:hypothetical protein FJZ28_03830 [Candidatus Peregrinibacteria bacterium]|nr:hypothetical protein [Candidatus Peregrinibacteria bacterium]
MRTIPVLALCAFLATPVTVAAAPAPSAILQTVNETKLPLEYRFESHREEAGMSATVKGTGQQEGRWSPWYKQKNDMTLWLSRNGSTLTVRARMLVFGETMYLKLLGAEHTSGGRTLHMDATAWAEFPVGHIAFDQGMFPFLGLWNFLELDLTGANDAWTQFLASADTMMMEETRFKGGSAYSLMEKDGPVKMRVRWNVKNDNFTFGKVHMSDGRFSMTGEVQPHGAGVVIDVPKETISADALKSLLIKSGLADMLWTNMPAMGMKMEKPAMYTEKPLKNKERAPDIYGTQYRRPTYVPVKQPDCYQTGYAMAGCGTRYTKRAINELTDDVSFSQGWKQRVGDDRIIEAFDTVSRTLETAARKQRMHEVKALLSSSTIRSSGSDDTDLWLTEDILPFFLPTAESFIHQSVFLEDENGHRGVALEKVTTTAGSGRRRYFVIVLLEEREGATPAVADIFVNATLRDLKGTGWIE